MRSNIALEEAGATQGKRLTQLDKLLVTKSNQVFQLQAELETANLRIDELEKKTRRAEILELAAGGARASDQRAGNTGMERLAEHREKRHKRQATRAVHRDALGFPDKLSSP